MGSLAQSRRFTLRRARCRRSAPFQRRPRRRGRDRRHHAHRAARDRLFHRSAHRGRRSRWPKRNTRDPALPMVVLSHRASGQISRRGRGGVRRAPALCPNGFPISMQRPERITALPADQISGRAIRPVERAAPRRKERQHECRGDHVLTSGIQCRHRHDAASGDALRSASGSAPAAATSAPTSTASRISSSTWRSRARGGAARGRSPRRSRRWAAISMPRPASRPRPITRAC